MRYLNQSQTVTSNSKALAKLVENQQNLLKINFLYTLNGANCSLWTPQRVFSKEAEFGHGVIPLLLCLHNVRFVL